MNTHRKEPKMRRIGILLGALAALTGALALTPAVGRVNAAGGSGCTAGGPIPPYTTPCSPTVGQSSAPVINRTTGGIIPADAAYCDTARFPACAATVAANPGVTGIQINLLPTDVRTAAEQQIEKDIAASINYERTQRGMYPLVLSENLTKIDRRGIEMYESDPGLSRTGAPTDCPNGVCDLVYPYFNWDNMTNVSTFAGWQTEEVAAYTGGAVQGVTSMTAGLFVNGLVCGFACGGTTAHRTAVLSNRITYMSVGVKCASNGTTYIEWTGFSRGNTQRSNVPADYESGGGTDLAAKVSAGFGHRCPQPGPQTMNASVFGTSITVSASFTSTPVTNTYCSSTLAGPATSPTGSTIQYTLLNSAGGVAAVQSNPSAVTFPGLAADTYRVEARYGNSCSPAGSVSGDLPTVRSGLVVPGSTSTSTTLVGTAGSQRFTPVTPVRELDTRTGGGGGRLQAGAERVLSLPDVPATAGLATLNVTAVGSTVGGFVTVYPCAGGVPATSSLNYSAGDVIANQVTVGVSNSKVCVEALTDTDLVVDLQGYFATSVAGSSITPAGGRLWDTRLQAGIVNSVLNLQLTPPPGAVAVSMNVTSTNARVAGFVTVYPCGSPLPLVSNVNFAPGKTAVPNHVTVALPASGQVCLFTSNPSDLIADLTGWWTPSTPGQIQALATPVRRVDTRVGSGGGRFGQGEERQIIAPQAGLLVANVTATASLLRGFAAVYPCGPGYKGTSTVNFEPGQNVANATIVDASTGVCAKASVPVDLIVDVSATVLSS